MKKYDIDKQLSALFKKYFREDAVYDLEELKDMEGYFTFLLSTVRENIKEHISPLTWVDGADASFEEWEAAGEAIGNRVLLFAESTGRHVDAMQLYLSSTLLLPVEEVINISFGMEKTTPQVDIESVYKESLSPDKQFAWKVAVMLQRIAQICGYAVSGIKFRTRHRLETTGDCYEIRLT